jgi:hypothetical protein
LVNHLIVRSFIFILVPILVISSQNWLMKKKIINNFCKTYNSQYTVGDTGVRMSQSTHLNKTRL